MGKIKIDNMLMFVWVLILVYGSLMVFSASSIISLEFTNNESMFFVFKRHLFNVLIGVVVALIVARSDYTKWKPYIWWLNIVTIVFLVLVGFTPLGVEVNGATRWIDIGFQFQPSELAKVTIIITVAAMLDEARRFDELHKFNGIGKIMLYVLFYALLIYIPQNHASVVMIIILTVGVMLFVAGFNKLVFFGSFTLLGVAGILIALTSEFRKERLLSFTDPLADKMGDGYQITQNWYALGSGEITGVGLGYGRQRFGWLPEVHTDFILGSIGEELGYIGILFAIILFILLIVRSVYVAVNSKDDFGLLLVSGAIGIIAIQVVLNMAVVSGLFPVTGIPLPFISYGGTSTIIMCLLIGIIFSVNKKTE